MYALMITDAVRNDPTGTTATTRPSPAPSAPANAFFRIATIGGTLAYQKMAPTREQADKLLNDTLAAPFKRTTPTISPPPMVRRATMTPHRPGKIQATLLRSIPPMMSANPPETGLMTEALKRVKNGKLYLIPASETRAADGTTGLAKFWKAALQELLQTGAEADDVARSRCHKAKACSLLPASGER